MVSSFVLTPKARLVIFVAVTVFHLLLFVSVNTEDSGMGGRAAIMTTGAITLVDFSDSVMEQPRPVVADSKPAVEVIQAPVVVVSTEEQSIKTPEKQTIDQTADGESSATGSVNYHSTKELGVLPTLPTRTLRSKLEYPVKARLDGVEATVYLRVFMDNSGVVKRVEVVKELPGYGFGESAKKALLGVKGRAGKIEGKSVATMFLYPVRFVLQ